MPNTPVCCTLPKRKSLLWLTEAGKDLPDHVRNRLISIFFTSITPLVIGMFCDMGIHLIAVIRQTTLPFVVLLTADIVLSVIRITTLWRTRRSAAKGQLLAPDLFIVSGIIWTALVGVGTALCVASRDPVLQFLAPTTMMGIVAGLVTRNNCAPRLALLQVALCDLPLQFAIPLCGEPWMLVSILQCPLFLAAMAKTIYGISQAYLGALMAKRDSEERATHDGLTGLWNRSGLMQALARNEGDRAGDATRSTLFYIDLDGFKGVNDALGHAAGDELLRQAAMRISAALPDKTLVARFGGDEFIAVVSEQNENDATAIGDALIAAVSQPYSLGAANVPRIGASVGITLSSLGRSPDELLSDADSALYRAKAKGKGCCVVADVGHASVPRASRRAA